MLEDDRTTVGNEVTLVKTRWKDLEEKLNEKLKKWVVSVPGLGH